MSDIMIKVDHTVIWALGVWFVLYMAFEVWSIRKLEKGRDASFERLNKLTSVYENNRALLEKIQEEQARIERDAPFTMQPSQTSEPQETLNPALNELFPPLASSGQKGDHIQHGEAE